MPVADDCAFFYRLGFASNLVLDFALQTGRHEWLSYVSLTLVVGNLVFLEAVDTGNFEILFNVDQFALFPSHGGAVDILFYLFLKGNISTVSDCSS